MFAILYSKFVIGSQISVLLATMLEIVQSTNPLNEEKIAILSNKGDDDLKTITLI